MKVLTEEVSKMSDEELCQYRYDYMVGTAEYEHYYRMEQPTKANLKCGEVMKEIKRRGIVCNGVGGVEAK